MPFKRSFARRSTTRRRSMRRRYKRPMTVGRVKRIIAAELKLRVIGNDFLNIPAATGNIQNITNIAQGDTNLTRTGNWIQPITIHGYVVLRGIDGSATPTNNIRVGIIRWMNDASIDVPTIGKIMFDSAAPNGPFSIVNKGSFKVLWSRTMTITNDMQNPQFQRQLRFYVRTGRGSRTLYAGGTLKRFQLYFFAFSNDVAGLSVPQYMLDLTFRFTDS